jgi:NADH:ubiquinone oxidoreductase subunit F (NADH-binding)
MMANIFSSIKKIFTAGSSKSVEATANPAVDQILEKLEKAEILGRGGAAFPAHRKWQRVKGAGDTQKYLVCNASEGELGVKKDFYILDNFLEDVFKGMIVAMDFLDTEEAYININSDYYQKLRSKIDPMVEQWKNKGYTFNIFQEEPSYIGGESSTLLNAIEGKRSQPSDRQPSNSINGINGHPTLIHNVETLYDIALVAEDRYENKRFYTLGGQASNPGVYYLPKDWTVERVLQETNNYPTLGFFVQVGGGASGVVWGQEQIKIEAAIGCASVEVYPLNMDPKELLLKWFRFYEQQSCGKCTPCREGSYQLRKLVEDNQNIPWASILDITQNMKITSFCALGMSLAKPIESYLKNVLKMDKDLE